MCNGSSVILCLLASLLNRTQWIEAPRWTTVHMSAKMKKGGQYREKNNFNCAFRPLCYFVSSIGKAIVDLTELPPPPPSCVLNVISSLLLSESRDCLLDVYVSPVVQQFECISDLHLFFFHSKSCTSKDNTHSHSLFISAFCQLVLWLSLYFPSLLLWISTNPRSWFCVITFLWQYCFWQSSRLLFCRQSHGP